MAEYDENAPNPPPVPPTPQAPHTISTIKLPFSEESINEVSTAYDVSTSSSHNLQKEGSSSYTDDLMYSFFANQSSGPQLDHEDLEQVDEFDLEEIDLKWQVAMISIRLKKFYKKTRRTLRRDAGNTEYKARDNVRRPAKQDEHKAMVTFDGEGVDWTGDAKDDTENYALMAFNSSNSSSDTEVTSCSKVCEESYAKLKKLYDEQREQLGVASIEIQAYTLALKKMSAKDKSRLWYVTQIHKGVLSYENEVLESVFDSRSSDVEDSHVNDRFAKVDGMHAVPPSMTGIYMPSKSDFRIDESKFTYAPKQSKTSESDAKTSDLAS
nr:ribonuclease H-like domain-containing protein [Tanacetum cinerariifolium]